MKNGKFHHRLPFVYSCRLFGDKDKTSLILDPLSGTLQTDTQLDFPNMDIWKLPLGRPQIPKTCMVRHQTID